jgi:hypothetical protein
VRLVCGENRFRLPTAVDGPRMRPASRPCARTAARFTLEVFPLGVGGGVKWRVVVAVVVIVSACAGTSSDDSASGTTAAESVAASPVSATSPAVPTTEVTAVEAASSEPDAPSPEPTSEGLVVAPMSLTPSGASPTKVLVGHGDGFMSVTADGSAVDVASSSDGLTWSSRPVDLQVGGVQMLASDGSRLALVGWDPVGTGGVSIWISNDDGATWTAGTLPVPAAPMFEYASWMTSVDSVAINDGLVVALGRLSQNVDWRAYATDQLGEDHGFPTGQSSDGSNLTVEFQDGYTLTVDPAEIGVSVDSQLGGSVVVWVDDGAEWERFDQPFGPAPGYVMSPTVVHGPAGFATVTPAPPSVGSPASQHVLQTSHDGRSWSSSPLPDAFAGTTGATLVGGPGGYVALGNMVWFHSPDGVSWTEVQRFDVPTLGMAMTPSSRPVGGGAGYAVPIIGVAQVPPADASQGPSFTARVLWSPDGETWEEASLPEGTSDVAVAVSARTVLVEPRSIDTQPVVDPSAPTLPADDAALLGVLTDAFYPETPPTNPDGSPSRWRPSVTESEARCIAEGLIGGLGVQRVRELNLGLFPWHLLGYALGSRFELHDAEVVVDTFETCSPTWELLMILSATGGTEWISEESAECTRDQLDDADARSVFVAELDRAYDDSGPFNPSPNLSHLDPLLAALDECLTDQELNALDWN